MSPRLIIIEILICPSTKMPEASMGILIFFIFCRKQFFILKNIEDLAGFGGLARSNNFILAFMVASVEWSNILHAKI
jgi:hypothetical protein